MTTMTTHYAGGTVEEGAPGGKPMRTYKGYRIINRSGWYEVFRPTGAQLAFAGRTRFSPREAMGLVEMDLKG
jgi:hypothetical protein